MRHDEAYCLTVVGTVLIDRALPDPVTDAAASSRSPSSVAEVRVAGSRERVVSATLRCLARFGLSKTTVDDIAREAGISRATVYRVFPGGRDEIVGVAVDSELRRFFAELASRLDEAPDVEQRLVVAMTTAADLLAANDALAFLLAHEPEAVLPRVSFGELDRVLGVAGAFLAPYLSDCLEPEDARRVGEWVTRLVLSHVVCPEGAAGAAGTRDPMRGPIRTGAGARFAIPPGALDADRARRLVRQFVLPGLDQLTTTRPNPRRSDEAASELAAETA